MADFVASARSPSRTRSYSQTEALPGVGGCEAAGDEKAMMPQGVLVVGGRSNSYAETPDGIVRVHSRTTSMRTKAERSASQVRFAAEVEAKLGQM